MENNQQPKWYHKPTSLIVGFLLVGPFILPLVWSNPQFSSKKKIIISVIVIILSCLLLVMSIGSIKSLTDYYQQINNLGY